MKRSVMLLTIVAPLAASACSALVAFPDVPAIEDGGEGDASTPGASSSGSGSSGSSSNGGSSGLPSFPFLDATVTGSGSSSSGSLSSSGSSSGFSFPFDASTSSSSSSGSSRPGASSGGDAGDACATLTACNGCTRVGAVEPSLETACESSVSSDDNSECDYYVTLLAGTCD